MDLSFNWWVQCSSCPQTWLFSHLGGPHFLLLVLLELWLFLMICGRYLPPCRHTHCSSTMFLKLKSSLFHPWLQQFIWWNISCFCENCLNVSGVCPPVFRSSVCPSSKNCISWLLCLLNFIWIQPIRGTGGQDEKINHNIPTHSFMLQVTTASSPWFQPLL